MIRVIKLRALAIPSLESFYIPDSEWYSNSLLTEHGGYLLLETGDRLLHGDQQTDGTIWLRAQVENTMLTGNAMLTGVV